MALIAFYSFSCAETFSCVHMTNICMATACTSCKSKPKWYWIFPITNMYITFQGRFYYLIFKIIDYPLAIQKLWHGLFLIKGKLIYSLEIFCETLQSLWSILKSSVDPSVYLILLWTFSISIKYIYLIKWASKSTISLESNSLATKCTSIITSMLALGNLYNLSSQFSVFKSRETLLGLLSELNEIMYFKFWTHIKHLINLTITSTTFTTANNNII